MPERDARPGRAKPRFAGSDIWLLLSVLETSGRAPASLRDIIATGDYINHAILEYDEIAGGAGRLVGAGVLKAVKGGLAPTAAFRRSYEREAPKSRGVTPKFDRIEGLLDHWPSAPRGRRRAATIARKEYDAALRQYLEDLWKQ